MHLMWCVFWVDDGVKEILFCVVASNDEGETANVSEKQMER